jgi:hypothetical protein
MPDFVPAPEGTYGHSPDHVERSILQLIEVFRKPRNQEWLRTSVGQVQEIEDALWQLFNAFDLETGEGAVLDLIGNLLGERRDGRLDPDFRAALRARILVNQSDGHLESMLAVLVALVPSLAGSDDVLVSELYPAGVHFEILAALDGVEPATIARMLRQAKPAGVKLSLTVGDTAETMIWRSPAGADAINGWGAKWARLL